ncbi:MAG: hypothetical protein K5924_06370 [Chloroflexi bacterium]|nr:hypothetical protein [Chloroflexota bacterium]
MPSHSGRRKLSSIRLRRQLIRDLRAGHSLTDAAAHADVSLTTVHREMRRSGWFARAITRAREGVEGPDSDHVVSPRMLVATTSPRHRGATIEPARPVDLVIPAVVLMLQLGIAATLGTLGVTLAVGVVICVAVAVALSGALRTTGGHYRLKPTTEAVAIPIADSDPRPLGRTRADESPRRDAPEVRQNGARRAELGWLRNTIGGPELSGPEIIDSRGRRR